MQFPDLRDRERQRHEVEKDGMGGMSEGKCIVVDARPRMLTIPLFPRKVYRRTDKRGCEIESDHRSDLEVDGGPHDLPEPLFRKDLKVEEQKRKLDEAEGTEVCYLADPEVLGAQVSRGHGSRLISAHQKSGRDLIGGYIPHVATQTGPRHLVAYDA